jgi:acyl carrier protein
VTDEDVLLKLNEIFQDILDADDISLTRETTAEDIKDWDSANHINIVVSVEMRFKVRFTNAEVERLKNVGDFVDLIQAKLAAKA